MWGVVRAVGAGRGICGVWWGGWGVEAVEMGSGFFFWGGGLVVG